MIHRRGLKLVGIAFLLSMSTSPPSDAAQASGRGESGNSNSTRNDRISLAAAAASVDSVSTMDDRSREPGQGGYHPAATLCDSGGTMVDCTIVSAEATVEQAKYAFWNLWVSVAALVGLATTLFFNFKAWRAAESAQAETEVSLEIARRNADAAVRLAALAEENAKREGRAFLNIESFDWLPGGSQIGVKLFNFGRTPAYECKLKVFITDGGNAELVSIGDFGVVDPGHEVVHFTPIVGPTGEGLKALLLAGGTWTATSTLTYRDSFGETWERAASYQLNQSNFAAAGRQTFYLVPGSSTEVHV